MPQLYWNTISDILKEILLATMNAPEFDAFRLVGGTSLSLQIGHRMSVDIDLFEIMRLSSLKIYHKIPFGVHLKNRKALKVNAIKAFKFSP